MAVLAMMFVVVGCSSPSPSSRPDSATQSIPSPSGTQTTPSSSGTQTTDTTKELLVNMRQLAEQGKVINPAFPGTPNDDSTLTASKAA